MALLSQHKLSGILEDSLFLMPKITGNCEPLKIPGVRGSISLLSDSNANRVGLIARNDIDRIMRQVCDFFAERNQGFTWVVGPMDIKDGLPDRLLAHGFVPAGFHKIAGMYLHLPYTTAPNGSGNNSSEINIREISLNSFAQHIDLIARAYGVSPEYAAYNYRISGPVEVRSKFYLAYFGAEEIPVGYSASAYLPHYPVLLLRGAGVIPKYRGMGIYTAMIERRLADACADGIETVIVQAARATSYSKCRRLGFREACAIEWYQWLSETAANA